MTNSKMYTNKEKHKNTPLQYAIRNTVHEYVTENMFFLLNLADVALIIGPML